MRAAYFVLLLMFLSAAACAPRPTLRPAPAPAATAALPSALEIPRSIDSIDPPKKLSPAQAKDAAARAKKTKAEKPPRWYLAPSESCKNVPGRFSYSPPASPNERPAILDTCTGTLWLLPTKPGECWRYYSLTDGWVDEDEAQWLPGAEKPDLEGLL